MTKDQITARIIHVAADTCHVDMDDINPETRFYEDLGCAIKDDIAMLMVVENEFEIEISDEDGEQVKTIADASDLVARLLKVSA